MVCETFVDPSIAPDEIEMLDRFSTHVATEDQALVEAVQRGLRSRQVARPHLMASTEELVVHFDRLVAEALDGVAGLSDA